MAENETLMEFPCEFPIKIIGNNTEAMKTAITEITCRHFVTFVPETIEFKNSAKGNYLAITVTVLAENQEMLDAFYREVTQHPEIKMVL
jgi:putative lipoic acid-binding regulatory protein